jgi:hypothetical protein
VLRRFRDLILQLQLDAGKILSGRKLRAEIAVGSWKMISLSIEEWDFSVKVG